MSTQKIDAAKDECAKSFGEFFQAIGAQVDDDTLSALASEMVDQLAASYATVAPRFAIQVSRNVLEGFALAMGDAPETLRFTPADVAKLLRDAQAEIERQAQVTPPPASAPTPPTNPA